MTISNSNFFQAYILPHSVALRWVSQHATKAFLYASTATQLTRYCSTGFASSDDRHEQSDEAKDSASSQVISTLSSKRGRAAVGLLPSYLSDARTVSRYSPITNPNGALQLGVAESKLMEDWLLPMLNTNHPYIPDDAIYYQPTAGRDDFKASMAAYIEQVCDLPKGRIRPEGLIVGSGCNAVLENLCMTLADVGDGVLLPTPYYAAFEFDLGARAGLKVQPVTTEAFHPELKNQYLDPHGRINPQIYYPNVAALDASYEQSMKQGCHPRILLISHPMNPIGICYPPETIRECIEWCRTRKVHFICDEIYAGSVYRDTGAFTSALQLAGTELGPYVHWVYALSKDFAVSGLRIGAAYTENPEITPPMQKLNDLCQISSQTQIWTTGMLTRHIDATTTTSTGTELWTAGFRRENHKRLLQRYDAIVQILDQFQVPFLPAQAGLFIWIDLSQFLVTGNDSTAATQERILYRELIDFGLLLTPGNSMKNERPGFFRCVFTAISDDEFTIALKRMETFFQQKSIP